MFADTNILEQVYAALGVLEDAVAANGVLIAANEAAITVNAEAIAAKGYVNRGDPASSDFAKAVLTTDGNYHDLDLSSIIPDNAKLVLLRVDVQANAASKAVRFRKKGHSNGYNVDMRYTQVADRYLSCGFIVPPDNNGIVEYWFSNITWTLIYITVQGWYM